MLFVSPFLHRRIPVLLRAVRHWHGVAQQAFRPVEQVGFLRVPVFASEFVVSVSFFRDIVWCDFTRSANHALQRTTGPLCRIVAFRLFHVFLSARRHRRPVVAELGRYLLASRSAKVSPDIGTRRAGVQAQRPRQPPGGNRNRPELMLRCAGKVFIARHSVSICGRTGPSTACPPPAPDCAGPRW